MYRNSTCIFYILAALSRNSVSLMHASLGRVSPLQNFESEEQRHTNDTEGPFPHPLSQSLSVCVCVCWFVVNIHIKR
ncbi:hypothetical protein F5B22DRAFT_595446 [Xylaria bambusicola]|uniref:uncharacterized protein n=1 Tax=Xylaria bambusicola TaxID=326684 RepID=UPI00200860DD|nr:uncharacterized protein F5B22DRAFT_595446 [Xylaria bambusicola]KAI0521568.1 hypothetical protein F5B22DRAFT_595446 [Xylaria bambusicola]